MKRRTVNVAEAKAHLSELIELAAEGEEIFLARAGRPRAKIVGLEDRNKALRVPGKGKGRLAPKRGFQDPLPESLLELFEGKRPR